MRRRSSASASRASWSSRSPRSSPTAAMLHREKELQPLGPDPHREAGRPARDRHRLPGPFDVTRAFQAYRDDRNARLESWGWVDRKARHRAHAHRAGDGRVVEAGRRSDRAPCHRARCRRPRTRRPAPAGPRERRHGRSSSAPRWPTRASWTATATACAAVTCRARQAARADAHLLRVPEALQPRAEGHHQGPQRDSTARWARTTPASR